MAFLWRQRCPDCRFPLNAAPYPSATGGDVMAENGKVEYATATGNDYAEHEATYVNVMKLAKVGTVAILAIVVALGIWGTVGALGWTSFGIILALVFLGYGLY